MSPAVACLAFFLLPAAVADKKPADYARPELLIEPADLEKLRADKAPLCIIEAGVSKEGQPHISNAHAIDPAAWGAAFSEGQDAEKWADLALGSGVFPTDAIVIYDDNRNRDAARVWWILRYWGYRDVRLLNGGIKAWVDYGGTFTPVKPKPFVVSKDDIDPKKLKAQPERLVTKAQLLDVLKDENGPKHGAVVDARSEDEYRGTKSTAKRGGAIPGARRLEWSALIDPKTGRFKNADELTTLFAGAGIDPAYPVIAYGDSDGRAEVLTFALELMGGQKVRTYYRGWAEWGDDPDTPVVKPKADK